uniref:Exoribonuclease phosphorolytic domain-containing protein n=1 Tax=Ditylenchus dipsaci TaxID=166011 RepID=A0A915CMN0_9BILA
MRPRNFFCNSQSEFIQKLFEKKQRIDRREWKESRAVEVTFDKDSRMATASVGETRILCTVEAEISAPRRSSRPGAGSIQFSMEFLSMAHPSANESALDGETEECLTMLKHSSAKPIVLTLTHCALN